MVEIVDVLERKQLVEAFNDTAVEYPKDKTIHQLFEEQVELNPQATALVFDDQQLTYGELNARANQLARTLRDQGVGPEQFVAIMAERSVDMIVGLLGILKAGGAYVPIDPSYPAERVQYMLEDSGAKLLLTQRRLQLAHAYSGNTLHLDEESSYHAETTNVPFVNEARHLAYAIYTSGSTGQPKGVMVEHRSIMNSLQWKKGIWRLTGQHRVLCPVSFAFDAFVHGLFTPLLSGAAAVIVSDSAATNPEAIADAIASEAVTHLMMGPGLLLLVLDRLKDKGSNSLLSIALGGEALTPLLSEKLFSVCPHAEVIHEYGPTEASVVTTAQLLTEPSQITIGRPIANSQVYIVNEWNAIQPVGVVGELCISGAGLARGYLNRPELTAEKFVNHPFLQGERMYRTGDLACWLPDGSIAYMGRIDQQVKIRGYRIELGEIEARLLQIPAIREVAVLARKDASGSSYLCAYLVSKEQLSVSDLRVHLSEGLPGYMIPSQYVQVDHIPLTSNGKLDRQALEHMGQAISATTSYEAPRTAEENAAATVWQSVLGAERVGAEDHFFYLGGDSIKAIQVISRLRQAGYQAEMKSLFKSPTLSGFSRHLQPIRRRVEQIAVQGEVKATPILRWFFKMQMQQPHHFNQSMLLHVEQGLEEAYLRQAIAAVIRHHDALRLVVRTMEPEVMLWNRGEQEGALYELDIVDCSGGLANANAMEAEMQRRAQALQSSFDLEQGPLVKLGLFRCHDGDHLLIIIHHLAIDGVSWRILLEDLATAYEQAQQGQTVQLPEKSDSFQYWSEQLHAYANSAAMEKQLAYWQAIEQTPVKPLPKDRDVSVTWTHECDIVHVQLEREATAQLLGEAHRAYGTEMNDLLLAALSKAIQEWAGIDELVLHMEGHGREALIPDVNITRTVGWFTSMYPVKLSAGTGNGWGTRIKQVKEELRQVPSKGMGYGMLRYVSENYTLAGQLKPEIVFNYLGQFDSDLSEGGWGNSPYAKATGNDIGMNEKRQHVLDINGAVNEGQLSFTIRYSKAQYERETLEQLAVRFQSHLQDIIVHCTAKEQGELTPSDVLLTNMSIQELDQLSEQMGAIGAIENVYPLTPMQKGMLFHSIMEAEKGAYFQQSVIGLRGPLDVEALSQSLERLQQRHEILRSNVYQGWKEAVLVIFRRKAVALTIEDIRSLPQEKHEEAIRQLAEQDRARGFGLESDCLMRAAIVRTGTESWQLIWSFHHLLMDGWCMPIVWGEWFETYFALVEHRESKLPATMPYGQYMEWLQQQDEQNAANYWNEYINGYDQHIGLPGKRPTKGQQYVLDKHHLILSEQLTQALQAIASNEQATLNTVMQAAWGILLQKYNGSSDVVFGSVVSGRPASLPGVEQMVGLFINTIPVRIQSQPDERFVDIVRRNQEQALASAAFDFYPLYQTQAQTGQRQDLINHILIFENYPMDAATDQLFAQQAGQRRLEVANMEMHEHNNYDFSLVIIPGTALSMRLEYNAEAYDGIAIERLAHHWLHLLEQIVANPQRPIAQYGLVTEVERQQLVERFNATQTNYPRHTTVHQLFEAQVEKTPNAIAIVFEDQQLTYRELNERANQLARTLRNHGIGKDQLVALIAERSMGMIVGMMAVLKAGGAYVPIDPTYPAERVRYMLEDSGAKLLLTQSSLHNPALYSGTTLYVDEESCYQQEAANLPPVNGEEHLAYVIYTSGSTGKPKGVMVEHRNVNNFITGVTNRIPVSAVQKILVLTTLSFDIFVLETWLPLSQGLQIIIADESEHKDAVLLGKLIQKHQVDMLQITPSRLKLLVSHEEGRRSLRGLQHILIGGESVSISQVNEVRQWSNAKIYNMYGPTETTVWSTMKDLSDEQEVSIGTPIANTQIYMLDSCYQLLPVGVAGQLCIAGAGVTRGYLNRPDLTEQKFVDNPFVPGERLYLTGDLARWLPDGNIEYLSRMDHQVKIRGYRIELGEIEEQLQQIPMIIDCAVLAKEDESGSHYLCAYVVAEQEVNTHELRLQLLKQLPDYMVPSQFIRIDAIPLTANGKANRLELLKIETQLATGTAFEAPRSEFEAILAEIWQQLLHLEQVSINDNFFVLGGNSLLVMQLDHELDKRGVQIYPFEIFNEIYRYQTIKELNDLIFAEQS
nr:non-ribosomal peptide synthetase [Paenibacillus sp. MMS18-CY102]